MRFIHMADVHLGAVPDSGCPWSAFRENEIWETFVRVIDQIREEKIELLLIAGDLFHRQPLPSQTERVSQLFASIPDTEVVWMAGSHDYLREDSAYRKVKWTKNVHGFPSEKPEVISLEKLHTKVYGCSYEHPEVTEAIYSSIRPEDQPGIHILLAYGGDETHIPMKKEDGAGFDYVALGYRHIPGVLVENQMAYAGSPEPIRLEETGTHGVVYGEITEDEQGQYHTQITLVPCACRSYIPLSLRIHSGTTQAALEQKVQDAIAQKGSEDIYWLRIQGYRNPELEFELKALTAQINPHFLYNSLSVINWMAIRSNQREISRVTLSLSMFYRTALSKGQDMVTVDNCIQNIKAYLDIQLVMHDNDFQVIWDIDPEVKGDIVPKLLLQPVVENALEHGLDMKEEGEKILKLFFVKDGEDVLLAVEDNGPGMEQEEADKLVTYKASGYGLKNVNDRMQLLYGMEYGIKVFSQIDQGTRVEMRIPREKADEEAVAAGEFSAKKFLQEPEEDTEDTTGKKGGKSEEKK